MRDDASDAPRRDDFVIRPAQMTDADAIAAAHRDSIQSIGPRYYDAAVVSAWASGLSRQLYVRAMVRGEKFFVAVPAQGGREILGFSSHRVDGDEHGTSVYVRGNAARHGIGTALMHAAESSARAAGAAHIDIDASLSAVDFYRANGFVETGRGEHRLPSGDAMACVFMRKTLAR